MSWSVWLFSLSNSANTQWFVQIPTPWIITIPIHLLHSYMFSSVAPLLVMHPSHRRLRYYLALIMGSLWLFHELPWYIISDMEHCQLKTFVSNFPLTECINFSVCQIKPLVPFGGTLGTLWYLRYLKDVQQPQSPTGAWPVLWSRIIMQCESVTAF